MGPLTSPDDQSQFVVLFEMRCVPSDEGLCSRAVEMDHPRIHVGKFELAFEDMDADVVIMLMGVGAPRLIILRRRAEAIANQFRQCRSSKKCARVALPIAGAAGAVECC